MGNRCVININKQLGNKGGKKHFFPCWGRGLPPIASVDRRRDCSSLSPSLPLSLSPSLPLSLSPSLPLSLSLSLTEPLETSIEDDKQEKPLEEEIPEIKVEPAEGEEEMAPKKKRTSFAVSPSRSRTKAKPLNEIPDQGIQMKGYVHRKKGTFGGWERTYCVVTFTAMYFTTGEDVREYHHMCMFDGVGSVKREKKGHDKQSESLFVKSGKNKETLSLAAGELQTWFSSLEEVLGVAQVNLELGSEDEDDGTPAPPAPAAAAVPIIEDGERGSCVVHLCVFLWNSLAAWMCALALYVHTLHNTKIYSRNS